MLPSQQHRYDDLPELTPRQLHDRREGVFLLIAGLFLGTLAMLNILGISKFVVLASISDGKGLSLGEWGEISFAVAIGVLPYPITFLCTDFISELYGKKRANMVVWIGLLLNVWVIFILWLGGILPPVAESVEFGTTAGGEIVTGPPLPSPVIDDQGEFIRFNDSWTFMRLRGLAFGAVTASMIAYLIAQLVDVHVFHFWKKLTRGKHLWLRNNGSTLVSQLVDTAAVILITHFYARALPIVSDEPLWPQLMLFIGTGYAFKLAVALLDTVPFYFGAHHLSRALRLPPPGSGHAPETAPAGTDGA
ncbi:MAG: VUT family protein [Phycisphaera sp.]|nr:MAG: VUT family protein [Phycisphaera sp.]